MFNDESALRELYGAITGRQISEDETIEIVTLEDAIHNDLKNDLAFILGLKLIVLVEQQSTDSPNLPVRMFCYLAAEYEMLLDNRVYGTAPVTIPNPELYVFYNGKEDRTEEWEHKLSELFAVQQNDPAVEVVVKVFNINYEKNIQLLEKCETLRGYSFLLHKVHEHLEQGSDLDDAMELAIRECIEEDVIADFLKKNGRKVMSVLRQNLTEEEKKELWQGEAHAKGRAEGLAEGHAEERKEVTEKMKSLGASIDFIESVTGLSREAIEAL